MRNFEFLQLVLGIHPTLTPNIVNKSLKTSEVSKKESFKIRPRDRVSTFVAALVLSLFEADGAIEKCGGKKSIVYSCDA